MQNFQKHTQQTKKMNQYKKNGLNKFSLVKPQQKFTFLMGFMRLFKIKDELFKCVSRTQEKEKLIKLHQSFYSKTLKKIQFQNDFVTLHLKKINKQSCSTKQFVQYLDNLNNQFFDDLETFFQYIHSEQNQTLVFKKNIIKQQGNDYDLQDVLEALKNKNFFMVVTGDGSQGLYVDKLILSKTLLSTLGYEEEELKMNFLKYKDVNVDFMDKYFYQKFLIQVGKKIKKTAEKQMVSLKTQGKQPFKKALIQFQDFVYKKRKHQKGQNLEKLQSKIYFYKPFSETTVIEFEINQQNLIEVIQVQEIEETKIFQEWIKDQQIKSLDTIIEFEDI